MVPPHAVIVNMCAAGRASVADALSGANCRYSFASIVDAEVEVARRHPVVVVVAASDDEPGASVECLRRLHGRFARPSYVFIAGASSEDLAIAVFHAGAQRYLKRPWDAESLRAALSTLLPSGVVDASESEALAGGERLVGRSEPIRGLRAQILRIAPASSNVLILGETGTGKELVAELIHRNGPRSAKPFVGINTAAIPDALLENELFGHERGAFTGATTMQGGKMSAAQGGTIFLDEIGEVSAPIQAKLLRAIESKAIYRLGGTRSVPIDVRVIAATNSDLERAIADGRFRRDLYYRLDVVRVEVPPLRTRVEDIPMLVGHYLLRFNRELGRSVRGLSTRAMDSLCAYSWPGNVRELRNVVEALLVNLAPETTGVVDVPPEVMRRLAVAVGAPATERERLLGALAETNWNKTRAATKLRMSRMTLYRKMNLYSVSRPQ